MSLATKFIKQLESIASKVTTCHQKTINRESILKI